MIRDLGNEEREDLMSALIQRGWYPPFSARIADFTDAEIMAGGLKQVDADVYQRNLQSINDAYCEMQGYVSPEDAQQNYLDTVEPYDHDR
jgi:hypothetical protein